MIVLKEKIAIIPNTLEIKLPYFENFINIKNLNENLINNIKEYKNLEIVELTQFKNSPLYIVFKLCKFYNIDFKDIKVRQVVNIETEGEKDFDIKNINSGSLKGPLKGSNCNCIICKRQFRTIRSNIKRCNSKHYCYVVDYFSGKTYKKEIMK